MYYHVLCDETTENYAAISICIIECTTRMVNNYIPRLIQRGGMQESLSIIFSISIIFTFY